MLDRKQLNYLYVALMGVMPLLVTSFFNGAFYGVKVRALLGIGAQRGNS
jgi:hypothetical protein